MRLGVQEDGPFYNALIGKHLSKFIIRSNSLWTRVIAHKYKFMRNVWEMKVTKGGSQEWRAVSNGLDVLQKGLRWKIDSGTGIQMYRDPCSLPHP